MNFPEIIKSLVVVIERFRFAFMLVVAGIVWFGMAHAEFLDLSEVPDIIEFPFAYGVGALFTMGVVRAMNWLAAIRKRMRESAAKLREQDTMKRIFDSLDVIQVGILDDCLKKEKPEFNVVQSIEAGAHIRRDGRRIYRTGSPPIQGMLRVGAIMVYEGTTAFINDTLWDWLRESRGYVADRRRERNAANDRPGEDIED